MSQQATTTTEKIDVKGHHLVKKVKELLREGNVRRIIIKDTDGKTVVEVPMTIGVLGFLAAPSMAAIGTLAAVVSLIGSERVTLAGSYEIDTFALVFKGFFCVLGLVILAVVVSAVAYTTPASGNGYIAYAKGATLQLYDEVDGRVLRRRVEVVIGDPALGCAVLEAGDRLSPAERLLDRVGFRRDAGDVIHLDTARGRRRSAEVLELDHARHLAGPGEHRDVLFDDLADVGAAVVVVAERLRDDTRDMCDPTT